MNEPELLAPAGDWDCVRAAVSNGADAVYFGLPRFNARMRARNFTESDLPEVMRFLHNHGVKGYVALNVLIFPDELDAAFAQLGLLASAGVDAVIVQDVGLAALGAAAFPTLRVHASTQMTVTSPEGVVFAESLGVKQVVLARELSLRELAKFPASVPLEVFVHGALCVAYSGQCLTSEALGRRSANRGECAQACRMPYEMVVDGAVRDLGDKKYLLSPQDLAAVREIPDLLRAGVMSFKIEGRLKSPEYVAAVTSVYRKAIDAAVAGLQAEVTDEDWYALEMTFSRGLFGGWMHGVNHQELVQARFGKKRGALVGKIARVGRDHVVLSEAAVPVKPGDGLVFDTGEDTENEEGGRIYEVRGAALFFEHGRIDFRRIPVGARVWKTDDPALGHRLRTSYAGRPGGRPGRKQSLDVTVRGRVGEPMRLEARGVEVVSRFPLEAARSRPLSTTALAAQLGRLAETPFRPGQIENLIEGEVMLPVSELNRMRRELVHRIEAERGTAVPVCTVRDFLPGPQPVGRKAEPFLTVLCRTPQQLEVALASGIGEVFVDYEDIRRYKDAVARVREVGTARVYLATPRIQKAGEEGFFKLIANAAPDGVLVRNIGGISFFSGSSLDVIGDFSLNVANALTARVFHERGIRRLTISHDLNAEQVLALLASAPAEWFELTLHHHMPMFHMEHCAFAAFLSKGKDYTDCGRPCEKHRVHLRDRVGMDHPLRADVGCRNTLFNAVPQSGASFYPAFAAAGVRAFRIELLEESADGTREILTAYRDLLDGRIEASELWRRLRVRDQVGVTRGTYSDDLRPTGSAI